jgi:hypothetical protein
MLNFGSCIWEICSPICLQCKLGNFNGGFGKFVKGIKYCLFSCGAGCLAPFDGIYSCIKTTGTICSGSGLNDFKQIEQNSHILSDELQHFLSI